MAGPSPQRPERLAGHLDESHAGKPLGPGGAADELDRCRAFVSPGEGFTGIQGRTHGGGHGAFFGGWR